MKIIHAFIIILSLWLVGCSSQVPIAKSYPISAQLKMLAAHHWDVLAADTAQQLHDALSTLDNGGQPIVLHIEQPQYTSEFAYGFHQLLATQLIAQGFGVSENPSEGLPLRCSLQVISHQDPRPSKEIIITSSVMNGDRYITRISNIYYVGDNDYKHYIAQVPVPTRRIEVIGDE